jgi:hypothetical protein
LSLDYRITDSTVEEISRCCKRLCFLYIKLTPDSDPSCMNKLVRDEMPKLSYLYVDDSKNITAGFLENLVMSNPELRVICYGRTFFHHPKIEHLLNRTMNEIVMFNPYLNLDP